MYIIQSVCNGLFHIYVEMKIQFWILIWEHFIIIIIIGGEIEAY